MVDILEWSPHPIDRPGPLLVALFHLAAGFLLIADAFLVESILDRPTLGPIVALVIAILVTLTIFVPHGNRRGPGRIALVLLVAVAAIALHLALASRDGPPTHPGVPFGAILALVGILLVALAEWHRRQVRITLTEKDLTVFVRRYRLQHTLPLDAAKEVSAARTLGGRLFGYGHFMARVRKGTMKDHITKPLVGEEPPEGATRGNGWDEEERFHLVSAHPYRKVRRALENRILLAKMPPKEREEALLADRLAEDLDDVRV